METAIQFENVVKRYGKVDALRGVSFSVEKGEMFGLIGPDGAGKTDINPRDLRATARG
jgi:ABC-2 type transport system ATP-binding protein